MSGGVNFPLIVTVIGGAGLICGLIAYILARRKRRNGSTWAAWSFIFPPALLVLIILPTLTASSARGGSYSDPEDNDDEGHDPEDDDGPAVNAATRQVTMGN